ncbi:hypothetical protein DL96DRAFT_1608448 [Flagelloscypha sp. PMI_526]|nr:hypothetical protein DL96DRAFT_1608448 [Flagelloscypha sp. PMI_526]
MSEPEDQKPLLHMNDNDIEAQIPPPDATSASSSSSSPSPQPVSSSSDPAPPQRRPRLALLLIGYYVLIACFIVYAVALLLSLFEGDSRIHYKWYRDWYPSLWVATVSCFGLAVHLLFSVKKCYVKSTTPAEIALSPDDSPYAHLFNFGQPEVYSRIQTHVLALFAFFLLWSIANNVSSYTALAFELTTIQPIMSIIPWVIAVTSLLTDIILYARAWKIIEIHPTWTHTHIGDIDGLTGAGQVRL